MICDLAVCRGVVNGLCILNGHGSRETHIVLLPLVGGIIRNWKRRWFFLDNDVRELRYYKPPENNELLGCIVLSEVQQIRWASTHSGAVVSLPIRLSVNCRWTLWVGG